MTLVEMCEQLEVLTRVIVDARRRIDKAMEVGREVKRDLVAAVMAAGVLPAEGEEAGDCRVVAVGEWAVVMEWDGDGWRGNAFRSAVCGDCEVGP